MSVETVENVREESKSGAVDLDAPNVDVVIAPRVPTVDVPVRNAVGRVIRTLQRVDKSVIFALPSQELRGRAHCVAVKPSGRVLVVDKQGALLARFADVGQAEKHLKACKVDVNNLANWPNKSKKK